MTDDVRIQALYNYVRLEEDTATEAARAVMGKQDSTSKLEHARQAAKSYAYGSIAKRIEFFYTVKPFNSKNQTKGEGNE